MAKKLYALLIGITEYNETIALDNNTVIFPSLNGCVNDAKKIKSFLQDNYALENIFIKELYNEEATKENICNAFINHLGQGTEDDSVLFYFSGHGTQEVADNCFISETDGKLESIVSFFDENNFSDCLIADKELRYLINGVSRKKPHITVIIDSCHSGDATRNAEIIKINYDTPIEKKSKGTYTFSQREWKNFIFHNQFSPEEIKSMGLSSLIPEGNHILFSASESNESAYEIAGEAIFTKHLVNILNATIGRLSNQDLFDRVSMYMKYAYVQKPRMYAPTAAENFKTKGFLNATAVSQGATATAVFNQQKGWIINRGEINGLSHNIDSIILFDSGDQSQSMKAAILNLEIDHSILKLPDVADINKIYIADLDHLAKKTVQLYLALEDAIPKDAALLMDTIATLPAGEVSLVSDESLADYVLQHLAGMYYLSRKNDKYRPISEITLCPNYNGLVTQLKQLASWKFINELSKTTSDDFNREKFIKLEYALGDENYKPLLQNNELSEITIKKWSDLNESPFTKLKFRITNTSVNDLYIALLYLDINYASDSFLLEPSPYQLSAGNRVDLNIEEDIELPVGFYLPATYFNYEKYSERFKLIVSPRPFEIYSLKLKMLPEPPVPGERRSIADTEKSIRYRSIQRSKPFESWFTSSIDLIHVNPSYNRIDASKLKEMLDDKLTVPFAEGLFFTINSMDDPSGDGFNNEVKLKRGIEIVGTGSGQGSIAEKNVIIDVANWWSRRKRNNYYEEIVRRYPERTVIVSEGDSWFQHPLVYDIIDHLSKIYAIRCVAAAADTLSNYLSGERTRGAFFLDALRETKPSFCLISGGGNDILGSQFRDFLAEKPYSNGLQHSKEGRKFLKESFTFQMDKLMSIYESIFGILKAEFPTMKTIVHGYDYPVHLDYKNKGWLGRYMIEKGINEPTDRRTVIRYIMDEFNERLGKTAEKFPGTVYYLDLRNTIHFKQGEIDEWYDEIHPNSDGFQLIGLKFIKLIESLK